MEWGDIPPIMAKSVSTVAQTPWFTKLQVTSGLLPSVSTLIRRRMDAMQTL